MNLIYSAFETCVVPNGGHQKRGARINCGACDSYEETSVNSHRNGSGDDDDIVRRQIAHKFEHKGWRVGNNPRQHRCPTCVGKEKIPVIRTLQEKEMASMSNKVVMMNSTSTPALENHHMTIDERRIITSKLDDVHDGNRYKQDWCDEKVSKDLGVPKAWVAKVREDYFGPDVNEQTSVLTDAAKLIADIKQEHAARVKADEALMVRAAQIEASIAKLRNGS